MKIDRNPPLSELSIVLILRDREQFTRRWLKYYLLYNSHIKLIIADGSERAFFTESQYRKLPENISYFYDGPDVDIKTMIRKIKKSLTLVETEFTILASNDDFYILSGLAEAVEFLKRNSDWEASAGIIRDFSLINFAEDSDNTYGKVRFGDVLYKSTSIDDSAPLSRVSHFLLTNESFWHSVYRTKTLFSIYSDAAKTQINDLVLYELFINLKSAELGKLNRNKKSIFMLHQVHAEMEAYKINYLEQQNKEWKDAYDSLLDSFFHSVGIAEGEQNYGYTVKIHQKIAQETIFAKFRSALERLKYKYAFSKLITVINHLDPFTARIYRNREVRHVVSFLKAME